MSCEYIYKGERYTKERLIQELADSQNSFGMTIPEIFKSIATSAPKSKNTAIAEDTRIALRQRYSDAKNMLSAIRNSNESKEVKLKKSAVYKGIMERTQNAIDELSKTDTNEQLDYVLAHAAKDAKLVEALYNSNASLTFNELQFANSVVDTWSNIKNAFGIESTFEIEDEDIRSKVNNILNIYRELGERTTQLALQLIVDSKNGPAITEEQATKLVDTSFATQWVRDLTTTGIPIANKLAAILEQTNLSINKEQKKNHAEITRMGEMIKETAEFKRNGFNTFFKVQKDRNGKETLALVTRYSQKFWDNLINNSSTLRRNIKLAAGDKAKIKEAYQKYHAWNELHTVAFNALPFITSSKFSDSDRDLEVNRMKALGFSDKEIEEIILESQKRYNLYLERKEQFKADAEYSAETSPEQIPQGMTADQYVANRVAEFDELNNPLKYMDQKFYGAEKVTAYYGARYTYLIPAKDIAGKKTEYYDENFDKISSDPKLHEFYNWFTGFIKDSLSYLPQEEIEDLQSNFLPVLADRLAKEYGLTSLKESVQGLGDWFMKALTSTDYQRSVEVNPMSKKERRGFQTAFINDEVAIEDRSRDMVLMAQMFSDMALIYKHKNTVKAEVDTINSLIQDAEGSYKFNSKLNILEEQAKDATRIKSLADFTVRRGFYGIQTDEKIWQSETMFYDWKELIPLLGYKSEKAKRAKILEEEVSRLVEALKQDGLSKEQIDKLEEEISDRKKEYYALGGRKFSLDAVIDSSISATRFTALGFAPFSALRNLFVGKINNYQHAHGGRDFNKRELLWANNYIKTSTARYLSGGKINTDEAKLIFGLMSDASLAEGEDGMYLQVIIDKHSTVDKIREMMPKAFTWLSSGDYHFKAEMLLAGMKHEKVKLANGEEISLIDAINADREYDEAKHGAWDKDANGGLSFDEFYDKKILKYKQLAKKLHGAVGKDIYLQAKDNAIGRMLILFKSWLPETVGVRFDPKHTDPLLDREEEGYYRTFARVVGDKKLQSFKLFFQAITNQDIDGIDNEMDLANFKKAAKELQVIVTLWMAYMFLKSMAPDDDRKKKLYNMLVLRQIYDLNRDLTYYTNINSVAELQRDIIPVIRMYENFGAAAKAVAYYGFGVEKDNGELKYDGHRTLLKITKVIPVLSNINRMQFYQKAISQ